MVHGFPGAVYKSFPTREEAERFVQADAGRKQTGRTASGAVRGQKAEASAHSYKDVMPGKLCLCGRLVQCGKENLRLR